MVWTKIQKEEMPVQASTRAKMSRDYFSKPVQHALLFLIMSPYSLYSYHPPVKKIYSIGLSADKYSPDFDMNETVQLLNDEVGTLFDPPTQFQLVRVGIDHFKSAARMLTPQQIDFILTDPDILVCNINTVDGLVPLASLRHPLFGKDVDDFGAVILVRNDSALSRIHDLVEATISLQALYEPATLMLWQVLDDINVRLLHDPRQLVIRPNDPQRVVRDVLDGIVDAGFLPAPALNALITQDLIDPRSLRILPGPAGSGNDISRPWTSTISSPAWTLAALAGSVATDVQRAVLAALLRIDSRHPAAVAGGYAAWLPPAPLHELRCVATASMPSSPTPVAPSLAR